MERCSLIKWRCSEEQRLSENRTQPPLSCQLFIQLEEEGQEVPVGVNGSFLDNMLQSISQSKTLPQHQVRYDQSGRSTHTHDAVHQNFSCRKGWKISWGPALEKKKKKQYNIHIQFTIFAHQGFVYEVSCRFKVLTEVKVLWILRWDAKVNAGVPIKTLVTNAALLGVRCVQDMSDAKLMQCLFILCYSPVDMEKDGKKE